MASYFVKFLREIFLSLHITPVKMVVYISVKAKEPYGRRLNPPTCKKFAYKNFDSSSRAENEEKVEDDYC